jgi:hypothetical protein
MTHGDRNLYRERSSGRGPDGVCEANRVPCDKRLLAQVHCKLPKLPRQPAIVDLGLMIRSQISNQGRLSCLTLYFIDPLLNVLHAMPQALVSPIFSYQRTVAVGHCVVLRSAFPSIVERMENLSMMVFPLTTNRVRSPSEISVVRSCCYRYRGSLPSDERARGEWRRYKLRIAAKDRAFLIFRAPPVRILMEVISRHGQLSWSGVSDAGHQLPTANRLAATPGSCACRSDGCSTPLSPVHRNYPTPTLS